MIYARVEVADDRNPQTPEPFPFSGQSERVTRPELAHLELLAEVDSLAAELQTWTARSPDWPPARHCQMLVKRLTARAETLRVRLEAPLVVATLGGTGTGKSSLVNALVGSVVTAPGRQRPTTRQPVLICRPEITPAMLGIDPAAVQLVQLDTPALHDLVLLDCPDPDTTEDPAAPESNSARLHKLLPHCDVLLVTTTQQKYRSAVVSAELAAAAVGARLVFVQTHADVDDDIRDDWRRTLAGDYSTGEIFCVDSLAALRDAEAGLQARGEFGRLVDLLTHELAGAAGNRIRRANFLDLLQETLAACRERIDAELPAIRQMDTAIAEQRSRLASRLAGQLREELLQSRRPWENRLLDEVASQWGFSPFSCLLRAYQGLGGLISGAALFRVRSSAQLALWGLWEGGRQLRSRVQQRQADQSASRSWQFHGDDSELRTASIIIDGYAAEAGLPRDEAQLPVIEREVAAVASQFVTRAGGEVQSLITRQAARHTGWLTRWSYELLLAVMLGLLVYRY
ncbi:MAG TPA: hypothetical protein VHY20_16250, partial [Pirellulales bacterium]|nr:hypothetical protein [Pirellulales bacterium]